MPLDHNERVNPRLVTFGTTPSSFLIALVEAHAIALQRLNSKDCRPLDRPDQVNPRQNGIRAGVCIEIRYIISIGLHMERLWNE
jgi:hypothetical protein